MSTEAPCDVAEVCDLSRRAGRPVTVEEMRGRARIGRRTIGAGIPAHECFHRAFRCGMQGA